MDPTIARLALLTFFLPHVNHHLMPVNNRTLSTKATLLSRLRSSEGETISGEHLASELGISRVAVWKAAEALRNAGYAIEAEERGYRLEPISSDDFLFPWEFGENEGRFRHWDQTDSTMNRARELADKGAKSGTIAVAEKQSSGRGRAGRSWRSENGGLFFTMILDGGMPIQRYNRTVMAVQIAVARAIQSKTGIRAYLHWPNDVYVRGRKIAGILSELRGEADRVRWLSVGVGVNVNNATTLIEATSCMELTGTKSSRRELLHGILHELESDRAVKPDNEDLVRCWNAHSEGINAMATAQDAEHGTALNARGRFLGIDEYGMALLKTEETTLRLEAGSASLAFDFE